MEKQFSKRIQKTMREEARKMREEKRVKSGFYPKLTTALLLFVLLIMAWSMNSLNKVYNEVLSQDGVIYHNHDLIEQKDNLIPVRITCYNSTGNVMANGEYPKTGQVAVSDRTIPLNSKLELNGIVYNIGDRTNKRFESFDLMTVDIYWEGTKESCLDFGVQYGFAKILDR